MFSGPIVTGPFRVAGLTWDGGADLAPGTEIHLRVRENGLWSDWLATPDEQAADSRGRHGTAPFVTGGADAVQVHISGNPADLPSGLDLDVIQGGTGHTAMGGAPLPVPNTAPVANAGPDKTAKVGSTVTLTGTATDANGDPLTFQWTQTGGSPTVTLIGGTTLQTMFTAPTVPSGKTSISLTFKLTVTDFYGATGTDTVVVKVVKK